MYSWVMKYWLPTMPKSNTGTMFECTRLACRRASSTNWATASCSLASSGRSRFSTNVRLKPSTPLTSATNSSAIPPSPSRASRR